MTVGIAVFLAAYLSWQALHWLPGDREVIGDLFFVTLGGLAIYLSWRASRRCPKSSPLRWFWLFIALALTGQAGGDLITLLYDVRAEPIPFPSLADFPYLSLYVFMFAALLSVPLERGSRVRRATVALDMGTVILGGSMIILLLALEPAITEGGQSAVQAVISAAYPVGDIVLLAGLSAVLLHWNPPAFRRPLALVTAGILLFIIADIAYADAVLRDAYTGGDPIDIFWFLALVLLALGAAEQRPVEPETGSPALVEDERRPTVIPLLALLVGGASVLATQWGNPFFPDIVLVLAALMLGALVTSRQFFSQRETLRLQRELQIAHDQLSQLANRDSLTELANRRAVGAILANEIRRAQRYDRHLSILFIDIDHFKEVNDRDGHAAGDRVLREFSAVVGGALRPTDVLSRWGGEEFLALLPEAGAVEALRTAERIRAVVEESRLPHEWDESITCSIGIASYPADALEAQALIERSDEAMYSAKQSGRNCVVVTNGPPAPGALAISH